MIKEVNCKVIEASAFRALLNEIYGEEVYVDFSLDGMYIDQPGDEEGPIDDEELYTKLAAKLGVQAVTGLHIDDDTPLNVWITFKDRDIIRESDYIATKLWSREDIAKRLWKRGYDGSPEEVEAVITDKLISDLEDCCDEDWAYIENAINKAQSKGDIAPFLSLTELRDLENAGDGFISDYEDRDFAFRLLQDVERNRERELWFGGEVAKICDCENLTVTIIANGDVEASLYIGDTELERVKDRHNGGELAGAVARWIKNDSDLQKAIDNAEDVKTDFPYTLEIRAENWFEAFIEGTSESVVLDASNVYQAIEEVVTSWDWYLENFKAKGKVVRI